MYVSVHFGFKGKDSYVNTDYGRRIPSDDKSSNVRENQMHNFEILATLGTYDTVRKQKKT